MSSDGKFLPEIQQRTAGADMWFSFAQAEIPIFSIFKQPDRKNANLFNQNLLFGLAGIIFLSAYVTFCPISSLTKSDSFHKFAHSEACIWQIIDGTLQLPNNPSIEIHSHMQDWGWMFLWFASSRLNFKETQLATLSSQQATTQNKRWPRLHSLWETASDATSKPFSSDTNPSLRSCHTSSPRSSARERHVTSFSLRKSEERRICFCDGISRTNASRGTRFSPKVWRNSVNHVTPRIVPEPDTLWKSGCQKTLPRPSFSNGSTPSRRSTLAPEAWKTSNSPVSTTLASSWQRYPTNVSRVFSR